LIQKKLMFKKQFNDQLQGQLEELKLKVLSAQKSFLHLKLDYHKKKSELRGQGLEKINEFKLKIKLAKLEFQMLQDKWSLTTRYMAYSS
jgi:hypothetical protein